MRERAAEPVEFPDDQAIARLHIGECLLEAGAVGPRSAGFARKQLSRIHARLEQGIAWQVRRLPVVVTGDPHGAHPHVRKTPRGSLSYTPEIRQGFSNRLWRVLAGASRPPGPVSGNTCFSDTSHRDETFFSSRPRHGHAGRGARLGRLWPTTGIRLMLAPHVGQATSGLHLSSRAQDGPMLRYG